MISKAKMLNEEVPQMLLTELHVLQRVDHQNLIRVLEIMEDDKTFFIVSELVEGGDLHHRLQAVGSYNEQ